MENIKSKQLILHEGQILFDVYKIIKQINTGGMNSVIYLAQGIDDKDNKPQLYTVKVINRTDETTDEGWKRFWDECITSLRVSKLENIVSTYSVQQSKDYDAIIIVMEYVEGEDLNRIIQHQGPFEVDEALFLFRKILVGIKGLHSFKEKVIHRDLKPENILISKEHTTLKIIDFGISSVIYSDIDQNKHEKKQKAWTNEKEIYGTFPYISPNLYMMRNASEEERLASISEKCDFFSLGIILYEMLTGKKPFQADDYYKQEVIELPLKYDLPALSKNNPKIPTAVENIIFRCIACKDVDLKFQYNNVNEIIRDVDNVTSDPLKAKTEPLLKPYKNRTFQSGVVFDLEKEKNKLKAYHLPWLFWLFVWIIIILIGIIIILLFTSIF